jgi:glycosyltransferase involved in cell wall biosynthesis
VNTKISKLVSIVIPMHLPDVNYVWQIITSLNGQTYSNIEVCVSFEKIDIEIVNIFKLNVKWPFRYTENKNDNGIFHNLNSAISITNGQFIQILCQDDLLYSNCIELQVKELDKIHEKSILSFCQFDVIDEQNEIFPLESRYNYRLDWPEQMTDLEVKNALFYFGCMPGNLSTIMFSSNLIKNNCFFNAKFKYAGDFEFLFRAADFGGFSFVKSPMICVRRHSNQASITLGYHSKFRDLLTIYKEQINRVFVTVPIFLKILLIHERVIGPFVYQSIRSFTLRPSFSRTSSGLNIPFSSGILSIFLIVLTLNNRVRIFGQRCFRIWQ